MDPKAKEKLSNAWGKTKTAVVQASTFVTGKTKKAFVQAKDHIQTAIENSKAKKALEHQRELSEYRRYIIGVKEEVVDKRIRDFIDELGTSKAELYKASVKKIKDSFPIPKEQTVIWAYIAKETNRTGGIVITEKGIFIKTVVSVFEEKAFKKEDRKVSELFYFPWDAFEPEPFLSASHAGISSFSQTDIKPFLDACKRYMDKKAFALTKSASYYHNAGQTIAGTAAAAAGTLSIDAIEFTRNNAHANNPNGGHGLFAEQANTMADKAHFKQAKVIGMDNAKDGADRLVNGVKIQTKYHATASESVNAAFDDITGNYRYYNSDGTPMKLEVPKGQYDAAVEKFKARISEGKVPGINDPAEAEKIVVEGHYTHEQAVRMSKPGTIESLSYDVKTGVVTTACAFGISFLINSFLCYRKTKT